jgi:chemotaxis protein histidine kinase CheA
MPLADIRKTIYQPDYDRAAALEKHLLLLEKKQQHLSLLIDNIQKTISSLKGGKTMTDKEKFEGLKQELISHNELQYGKEVRSKYGENTVDAANAHLLNLSEEQFENMEETGNKIISSLEYSVKNNLSADSAAAKEIAQLHKHWLSFTWPSYSKEAHLSLVEMYVSDERFTVYYDKNIKGCALFLKNAVQAFIDNI